MLRVPGGEIRGGVYRPPGAHELARRAGAGRVKSSKPNLESFLPKFELLQYRGRDKMHKCIFEPLLILK